MNERGWAKSQGCVCVARAWGVVQLDECTENLSASGGIANILPPKVKTTVGKEWHSDSTDPMSIKTMY